MTHCERLLSALSDGQWHNHHSLYALNMIVHSRVADLRRKGYAIEQRRDGDLYLYRLVALESGETQCGEGPEFPDPVSLNGQMTFDEALGPRAAAPNRED